MRKNKVYEGIFIKILVIISFIGMIASNIMSSVLPLNNISMKELSDLYPNLFTPAPYTFGIWSIIYIALAGFAIYQVNPPQGGTEGISPGDLLRIRVAFVFSCVINALWLVSWHYRYLELSVILMVLLLITLIYINNITRRDRLSNKETLFVRAPFSLYFGWITVATIANITIFFVGRQWDLLGISPVIWTILVLIIGITIASIVVIRNRDLVYPAAVLWGYGGILANHFSSNGFGGRYYSIMIVTVACMVVLLVVSVVRSLYRD